jgi:hypothetical protein
MIGESEPKGPTQVVRAPQILPSPGDHAPIGFPAVLGGRPRIEGRPARSRNGDRGVLNLAKSIGVVGTVALAAGLALVPVAPAAAISGACEALTVNNGSSMSFVDNYRGECVQVRARVRGYNSQGQYITILGPKSSSSSQATYIGANSRMAQGAPYTNYWSDFKTPPEGVTYAVVFSFDR